MSGYNFYEMVMDNDNIYKYTIKSTLRNSTETLIPPPVLASINDYGTWSITLRPEVHLQWS